MDALYLFLQIVAITIVGALGICVALLLLVLVWILVASIVVNVDTAQKIYCIRVQGLVGVYFVPLSELQVRLWGIRIYSIDLLKTPKTTKPKAKSNTPKQEHISNRSTARTKLNWQTIWRKAQAAQKGVILQRFLLELDTDDYVVNAYLYPIFVMLSRPNRHFNINYKGELRFVLELELRAARILYAVLFK